MNLKKYIGIVYKDITMDEKEGYFNDLPKYVYDIKIEKTVGDEWIETGSAFVTYTHPHIYQKVEVHYLKDGEVIHKEIGICIKQKYSKHIDLYVRDSNIDDKWCFAIAL